MLRRMPVSLNDSDVSKGGSFGRTEASAGGRTDGRSPQTSSGVCFSRTWRSLGRSGRSRPPSACRCWPMPTETARPGCAALSSSSCPSSSFWTRSLMRTAPSADGGCRLPVCPPATRSRTPGYVLKSLVLAFFSRRLWFQWPHTWPIRHSYPRYAASISATFRKNSTEVDHLFAECRSARRLISRILDAEHFSM